MALRGTLVDEGAVAQQASVGQRRGECNVAALVAGSSSGFHVEQERLPGVKNRTAFCAFVFAYHVGTFWDVLYGVNIARRRLRHG